MKDILTRLFNHEELTSAETKQILLKELLDIFTEIKYQVLCLYTSIGEMVSITMTYNMHLNYGMVNINMKELLDMYTPSTISMQ